MRLRTDAQPYLPKTDLGNTAGCFQIDGAWAYRIRVDSDILRGSGRSIPEAFASYLGVGPLQKGRLAGPEAPMTVGWSQYPAIGSIRLNVEALGLTNGDYVFIRRATGDSVDFVGLLHTEIVSSDPIGRVRLLVGSDALRNEPIETTVARALGIGSAAVPTAEMLVGRLRYRGDEDLADSLQLL